MSLLSWKVHNLLTKKKKNKKNQRNRRQKKIQDRKPQNAKISEELISEKLRQIFPLLLAC